MYMTWKPDNVYTNHLYAKVDVEDEWKPYESVVPKELIIEDKNNSNVKGFNSFEGLKRNGWIYLIN